MTTTSAPELVLTAEKRSRYIRLEAPVPGTEHGLLHFIWSLDDGQDTKDARYSYWLWPDFREKLSRRYSHGYRSWQDTIPADISAAAEALWSAWKEGTPDPEGTVRRDARILRTCAVTGAAPFTTYRNETFLPGVARVLWVCGEGADRSRDFCTVNLSPEGMVPAWESAAWTHGSEGEYFTGNDAIPAWLAGLAETARTGLLARGTQC